MISVHFRRITKFVGVVCLRGTCGALVEEFNGGVVLPRGCVTYDVRRCGIHVLLCSSFPFVAKAVVVPNLVAPFSSSRGVLLGAIEGYGERSRPDAKAKCLRRGRPHPGMHVSPAFSPNTSSIGHSSVIAHSPPCPSILSVCSLLVRLRCALSCLRCKGREGFDSCDPDWIRGGAKSVFPHVGCTILLGLALACPSARLVV